MLSPLLDHAPSENHIIGGNDTGYEGRLYYQCRLQRDKLIAETEDGLVQLGKKMVADLRAEMPHTYPDRSKESWRIDIWRTLA